jgi:hypothetical protein
VCSSDLCGLARPSSALRLKSLPLSPSLPLAPSAHHGGSEPCGQRSTCGWHCHRPLRQALNPLVHMLGRSTSGTSAHLPDGACKWTAARLIADDIHDITPPATGSPLSLSLALSLSLSVSLSLSLFPTPTLIFSHTESRACRFWMSTFGTLRAPRCCTSRWSLASKNG